MLIDILIKNGLIIDGIGKQGYCADIGINDGGIVQIIRNIKNDKHPT